MFELKGHCPEYLGETMGIRTAKKSDWFWLTVILVPSLGLGAFGVISAIVQSTVEIEGRLHSEGGTLGTWTMTPDQCSPVGRRGATAVDLYQESNPALGVRVIEDPADGLTVNVNIPTSDNRVLQVRTNDCKVLTGHLNQQASSTGGIDHMAGQVELDCQVGGGHLLGTLRFEDCH